MNTKIGCTVMTVALALFGTSCRSKHTQGDDAPIASSTAAHDSSKKPLIQFIVGSTRQGRTSEKLATILHDSFSQHSGVATEVVDIKEYALPFFNDEIAPSRRETITDPAVVAWSQKIKSADGYIIVVPEYNAGYPGVLKNALDSLYTEWNNKPVAFVAYSGGPSGGTSVVAQLRAVTQSLGMLPTFADITIAYSWKAFDKNGLLLDTTIVPKLQAIVEKMIKQLHKA